MKTSEPSSTPSEKTDNELIAEFMRNGAINSPHIIKPDYKDWYNLMFVVEKISKDYDVKINFYDGGCTCYIEKQNLEGTEIASFGNFSPPIKNVYKAVVKFIKWFNSQQHERK